MTDRIRWALSRAYGTSPHGQAVRDMLRRISRRNP